MTGGPRPLLVLSDATGELAHHMVTTMLTQFPEGAFSVQVHNFLTSEDKWREALKEASALSAVVVHSTVNRDWKRLTGDFCSSAGMACFDSTGLLMDFLVANSPLPPAANPTNVHHLGAAYFRRVQAMEFTLAHDDGVEMRHLAEADIVLVGVSRTSKTPISVLLANKGFKVANVPLALELGVQQALENHRKQNVVGLTIQPSRLQSIREAREKVYRIASGNYSQSAHIRNELRMAQDLYHRKGWPVLDVTSTSIEEGTWHIMNLLELRPLTA